jgi:hypothetical protein
LAAPAQPIPHLNPDQFTDLVTGNTIHGTAVRRQHLLVAGLSITRTIRFFLCRHQTKVDKSKTTTALLTRWWWQAL